MVVAITQGVCLKKFSHGPMPGERYALLMLLFLTACFPGLAVFPAQRRL